MMIIDAELKNYGFGSHFLVPNWRVGEGLASRIEPLPA